MADLIEQCITHLRLKPQVIIIDEVDYLISRMNDFLEGKYNLEFKDYSRVTYSTILPIYV